MYKIYSDNLLIYDPTQEEYYITEGEYRGAVNESGSLVFGMTEDHPHYGNVNLMKSIITLYDDDRLIFRGRPYAPNLDLYKLNRIECEGELAFFNDTYQEPFSYFGTVAELFTRVINFHNSQVDEARRFIVGNITVTNDTQSGKIVRSNEEYSTTMEFIQDKFIGSELGGFLNIRHEQNGNYIDYLEDLNYLCRQDVEQTINLMDAEKGISAEDLATVVIPLGANMTDADGNDLGRLTIEEVNQGKKYIESADGITLYGRVTRIFTHDDITTPQALFAAGQKDLESCLGAVQTITLTAADLSRAGYDEPPFALGTYVLAKIPNLEVNERMLIKELNINLLDPSSNSLTLGSIKRRLTAQQLKTAKSIGNLTVKVDKSIRDQIAAELELIRETEAMIENSSEQLTSRISETYYNAAQTDQIIQQLQTVIEQTANQIIFNFDSFVAEQVTQNGITAEQFEEWRKYIRFINGNIEIGIVDNPMMLRLENDRITFLENGVEVAYWQNRKFYAVDGEFINSLQLGNFAFIPRETGNLSFLKNR